MPGRPDTIILAAFVSGNSVLSSHQQDELHPCSSSVTFYFVSHDMGIKVAGLIAFVYVESFLNYRPSLQSTDSKTDETDNHLL
jgi:hypothetical protein